VRGDRWGLTPVVVAAVLVAPRRGAKRLDRNVIERGDVYAVELSPKLGFVATGERLAATTAAREVMDEVAGKLYSERISWPSRRRNAAGSTMIFQ
jgi:hypothetical protein